ncbi:MULTISPECIES: polyprenyl synthetase family protein [unclassified Clostridium]|uniref:polyprenyl synthetase family protein n=1 Tax=unclassified Clostridium TaxID=2614128 RepID=UPI0025BCC9A3|nr:MULTISPECIES: farnesyl diphosphate synthase [unclassified Clostridium]
MFIKDYKNLIETWINEYFENKSSENKGYFEPMIYSLNIGGKRIRPILLLLVYGLYKEDYLEALPFAAAMEMIHTYSLIHDDLPSMDNDELRRGMATNHIKFGEARAILAGDGLLNEAMIIMFKECLKCEERKIKASNVITNASGAEGMILGQIIDIESENEKISEETMLKMHKNKTGQLIKASIISGAILGGATEEEIHILGEYGDKLGLAFQIKDDILDTIGDEILIGKSLSDSSNDKTTFVKMYGLEKCINLCEEITKECFELLNKLNKNTPLLSELTMFLLERQY